MNSPSLNPVNCWETLRAEDATAYPVMESAKCLKSSLDWAISNQTTLKEVEGSTIRESNRLTCGEILTSAGVSLCTFVCMPLFVEISMFGYVFKELEIFNSVILEIPINVMNYLFRDQISAKILFHDESMFHDISPSIFVWMVGRWNHNIRDMSSCDKTTMERVYDFDRELSCYCKNTNLTFSKYVCDLGSSHSCTSKFFNIFLTCSTVPWFDGDTKNTHIFKDVFFANSIFFGDFDTGFESVIIPLQFFGGKWNFYVSVSLHESELYHKNNAMSRGYKI